MLVIIYATHIDGYMPVLIDQMKKKGIEYKVLGYEKVWEGFFQRTIDYYDFLKTLDDSEIVMFVDGFDSLCFDNEKEIIEKYNIQTQKSGKAIVWGTDMDRAFYTRMFFGAGDDLINGGCSIGRVNEYKKVFEDLFEIFGTDKTQDDQKMINKYYYKYPERAQKYICLDKENFFFGNATYLSTLSLYIDPTVFRNMNHIYNLNLPINDEIDFKYDSSKDKVFSTKYYTYPSFLSGPGNICLDKIVAQCGYDFQNKRREKYMKFFLTNFLKDIIKNTLIFIVVVIFIVIIFYNIKKINFFSNKKVKKV